MDKERKHEKKPKVTLGDLIVAKDPKGGFGRVVHNTDSAEKDRPAPPGGGENQESASSE